MQKKKNKTVGYSLILLMSVRARVTGENDVKCTLLSKSTRRSLFLEEERVAEALTRYYGVEEILLPPRKLGERMPSFLMEFYNSLVREMAHALSAEAIEEESVTAVDGTYIVHT